MALQVSCGVAPTNQTPDLIAGPNRSGTSGHGSMTRRRSTSTPG